jgi:hypothetical protein
MEEQAPQLSQPIPEVSRKNLWLTVGLPPVVTSALAGILVGTLGPDGGASAGLLLSLFVFIGLLVCTTAFSLVVGKRYRGVSQAFLVLSYLLGQNIVCFALWLGIFFLAVS